MTQDVLNDIKQVLDISSRVDERVKIIQVGQHETHEQLKSLANALGHLTARVAVLEANNVHDSMHEVELKLERLEINKIPEQVYRLKERFDSTEMRVARLEEHKEGIVQKVKQYSGLIVQAVWVILVCYLLYKLGLNTPPIP